MLSPVLGREGEEGVSSLLPEDMANRKTGHQFPAALCSVRRWNAGEATLCYLHLDKRLSGPFTVHTNSDIASRHPHDSDAFAV